MPPDATGITLRSPPSPVEEDAARQVLHRVRVAQHVVVALHGGRVALELADGRAGVRVVDAREPQPLRMTRNEMPWVFCRV